MARDDTIDQARITNQAKGGLFGGTFNSSGLDLNVRAVMMDFRWTTSVDGSQPATTLTYAFPASTSDYLSVAGYPATQEVNANFSPTTSLQQQAILAALGQVSSYTKLTFTAANSALASDATLRFTNYNSSGSESRFPPNNGSYSPSDSRDAGDTFLGQNGAITDAKFYGSDGFLTIAHELGHAFGLKHGHDGSYNGMLASIVNDNEFSVMTYASYLGSNTSSGATAATQGSSPQSYMMYDIAALQAYYGANFSKVASTVTYRWDSTGQEFINGTPAANAGASSTGKIFTTVWTEGAAATYDFSNFNDNGTIDLRPGQWSKVSLSQLADLNSQAESGTAAFQAQGNVYNALLFNSDLRSEVSNVLVGNGNDRVTGNDLNNTISLGRGNDTVDGAGGTNTVVLSAAARNFAFTITAGSPTYTSLDKTSFFGSDSFVNVQRVQFSDQVIDTSSFLRTSALPAAQISQLADVYIGYFNRAPDAIGLSFWGSQLANGNSLTSIANGISAAPEAVASYPETLSIQAFVTVVYNNVLGRNPDQSGISFWQSQLGSGAVTKGGLVLSIVQSAQQQSGTPDSIFLTNKQSVGLHFALAQGLNDGAWARTVMSSVNGTAASVSAANAQTDTFAATAASASGTELVVKIVGIVA